MAGGALLAAAGAAAIALVGDGSPYRVEGRFINASQLVEGNLVRVAGKKVGSVEKIDLTDDSQALITFTVEDAYAPLRAGSRAVVRVQSLSGVANRYIDLQLGPAGQPAIPDGGTIDTSETESAVDVDQLFNIFDRKTRRDTSKTLRLLAEFNAGRAEEAQAALRYVSPSLAASSRLFEELSANDTMLERFIVETSGLVGDLAERDDDLAGLVANLSVTFDALASRRGDLGRGIELLPPFLRRANTTFVNLRAALDDLDPLVAESKPLVRRQLRQLFDVLRPLAREAEPTVRDLSRTIRRSGPDNDLVEFLRAQPAVDRIANQPGRRNGTVRPGAFPALRQAFQGSAPQLAFFRPYTIDLIGWFDDFGPTGAYDALGGFARAGLQFNSFSATPAAGTIAPVPPQLRDEVLGANLSLFRNNRCPGSVERAAPDGSNPWRPSPAFNCDPEQTPRAAPASPE